MLFWICPDCGRECSPRMRECPSCTNTEEVAKVPHRPAETVSVTDGILAMAETVQATHQAAEVAVAQQQAASEVHEAGASGHSTQLTIIATATTETEEELRLPAEVLPNEETIDSLVRPLVESAAPALESSEQLSLQLPLPDAAEESAPEQQPQALLGEPPACPDKPEACPIAIEPGLLAPTPETEPSAEATASTDTSNPIAAAEVESSPAAESSAETSAQVEASATQSAETPESIAPTPPVEAAAPTSEEPAAEAPAPAEASSPQAVETVDSAVATQELESAIEQLAEEQLAAGVQLAAEEQLAAEALSTAPAPAVEQAQVEGASQVETAPQIEAAPQPGEPTLGDLEQRLPQAIELQAEAILDVVTRMLQAEEARISAIVTSFQLAPAASLLSAPRDIVTAPAPPTEAWMRTSRPTIPASKPIHPSANVPIFGPQPLTLAGPSLPLQLRTFVEDRSATPPRTAKRASLPSWMVSVVVATCLFLGAGSIFQFLTGSREPKAAAAQSTQPTTAPAAVTTIEQHPFARLIEVTGIRVIADLNRKSQVEYIVVNHSSVAINNASVHLAVRSASDSIGAAPLFNVSAVVSLGPFQSKEIRQDLDSQLRATALPEWDNLRPDVQVSVQQ